MKKYVVAGFGVMFLGVVSSVHAEMEVKVKDNTANNGFSIKEETTGSTIARFRGDGKVGIGTPSPDRTLTLDDSSYPLLSFRVNGVEKGYIGWHSSLNRYQISTPGNLSITAGNTGGEQANVFFINNSGNVGIGTTNPAEKLEITGNSDTFVRITDNNNNVGAKSGIKFFRLSDAGTIESGRIEMIRQGGVPTDMAFYTRNSGGGLYEKMRIDYNGNVGIGTTNPISNVHIKGTNEFVTLSIENSSDSTKGTLIKTQDGTLHISSSNTDYVARDMSFNVHGSLSGQAMRISTSGNVGIGTTNPAYKLDVNGTIRGSNVSPSDMRWKEHVKTLDNSLEKVNKLRGVSFEWKDKAKGAGTQVGLIAQEVEKVFPEVVSEDNEGYKSVAYDKLVGVLVEAVKEQQRQVHELKASNETLKQEIDSIKKFISNYAHTATMPVSAQMIEK